MAAPVKNMRTIFPSTVSLDSSGTTVPVAAGALATRTTAYIITGALASNATENDSITVSKTFQLLMVQVSSYARVRLYSTAAARGADANRNVGAVVPAGTMNGVIADIAMTPSLGVTTWMMSPAALGFNDDSPVAPTVYAAITNLLSTSSTITVTLTYLPLE
jgi:hypothetical protein